MYDPYDPYFGGGWGPPPPPGPPPWGPMGGPGQRRPPPPPLVAMESAPMDYYNPEAYARSVQSVAICCHSHRLVTSNISLLPTCFIQSINQPIFSNHLIKT